MNYIFYNPNPVGLDEPDCATRALAKALNMSWEDAHIKIFINSLNMGMSMMNDAVWGSVLRQNGFYRKVIPNSCPDCYTVEDFCMDHPKGIFVLGFGSHTATVIDGNLYDSWDSSHMIPIYYWYKGEENDDEQPISGTERRAESKPATTNSK